jgi:hypothetical protein
MRIPHLVLLLSVVANLALGTVWLRRSATPTPPAPVANAPTEPVSPPTSAPLTPETWGNLYTADDASFVARLRAEGFPPRMMFVLVGLRVQAR